MAEFALDRLQLNAQRSALLVVDVEHEFCHPDGKRYLGERAVAAVQRLEALQARCREAGMPIVFMRSIREADDLEFTDFGREPILVRGTVGPEYMPEVAPLPGEPVVEKESHDPFNGTQLLAVLDRLGIRPGASHTVLVTGVATHICVTCAVIGLSVRNYQAALVTDCSAAGSQEQEELAYQLFSQPAYSYNVKLTTSDLVELVGSAKLA